MPIAKKASNAPTPPKPSQTVAPVGNFKPGSMLSRGVPTTQLKELYQKVLIYGPNRTGKTTLAAEWPGPILVVDFEPSRTGGAISISKKQGITHLKIIHKPQEPMTVQTLQLAAELRENNPFKTIVLDSSSAMQHQLLHELMGWDVEKTQLGFGTVSKEIYQERSEKLRDLLVPFFDLECHTIVIAHEKDHNPPKEDRNKLTRGLQLESFIGPAVGGATVEWLQSNCGYLVRLYVAKEVTMEPTGVSNDDGTPMMTEVETGKTIRRILCQAMPNFAAGFRSATPECVPEYIDGKSPKELYDRFQKAVRGEK